MNSGEEGEKGEGDAKGRKREKGGGKGKADREGGE